MPLLRFVVVSWSIVVFVLPSLNLAFAEEAPQSLITIGIPEKQLIDVMNKKIECIVLARDSGNSRMRNGALACAALLKIGLNEPVKKWLEAAGSNETVTYNTAAGEYVFAVRSYIDYSGDKAYLQVIYPKAVKALEHLRSLSLQNTDAARNYTDDFFALRGLKDGVYLANLMGRKEDAGWIQNEVDDLRKRIYDSITKRNDLDAGSAAIAVSVADELKYMPKELLKNILEKYFSEYSENKAAGQQKTRYEPYSASAFFRMDRRSQGLALLRYLVKDSVMVEACGSSPEANPDYIDAICTMFVYEDNGKLILGEGLPAEWFDQGIEVKDMPTPYGKICYVLKKEGDVIRYFIYGSAKAPNGVRFVLPKELSKCKVEEMKAKQ